MVFFFFDLTNSSLLWLPAFETMSFNCRTSCHFSLYLFVNFKRRFTTQQFDFCVNHAFNIGNNEEKGWIEFVTERQSINSEKIKRKINIEKKTKKKYLNIRFDMKALHRSQKERVIPCGCQLPVNFPMATIKKTRCMKTSKLWLNKSYIIY